MPRSPLASALLLVLLLGAAFAGCTAPQNLPSARTDTAHPPPSYAALGFDGTHWPSLAGHKLTILAYESYATAFETAKAGFENLTGAEVELVTANDAGAVLERAAREKGNPSFDVVYGVDNLLLGRAIETGAFEPYKPFLADRVQPAYAFVPGWAATPVNHGYIALNVDPRANLGIHDLADVKAHAAQFVTEDPRVSTPGLGFLIATVATYGEPRTGHAGPTYLDYWRELLAGGALVVADWTQAYENHFSGGYGQSEAGTLHDKPIVTSYTTSPAYELYYGGAPLNEVVLAPNSTFHQIQTMALAKGAKDPVAAQAWVEFCLTDAFQDLAASGEAIYPVAAGVDVSGVYNHTDPAPGTFQPAPYTYQELASKVPTWLSAWTDVYERARAHA